MRVLPIMVKATEREVIRTLIETGMWEPGRQGTGYEKMAVPKVNLAGLKERCLEDLGVPSDVGFDCYLLRYKRGAYIPVHKDDAPLAQEHHRVNVLIQAPSAGGILTVNGKEYHLKELQGYVFRPDLEEHSVSEILGGTRVIFTVGVLL